MSVRAPRWFQLCGWSDSGKTRVLAALAVRLVAGGRRVLAVKHSHHAAAGASFARTGSDTAAFLSAGAAALFMGHDGSWLATPGNIAVPWVLDGSTEAARLRAAIERVGPDWVLVEGAHQWRTPKVAIAGADGVKPCAPPVLATLDGSWEDPVLRGTDGSPKNPDHIALWILGAAERVARSVSPRTLEELLTAAAHEDASTP